MSEILSSDLELTQGGNAIETAVAAFADIVEAIRQDTEAALVVHAAD